MTITTPASVHARRLLVRLVHALTFDPRHPALTYPTPPQTPAS